MGPYEFKVNKEHGGIPSLTSNPLSWNNQSNLLIIDAQIGTGYSFVRGNNKRKKIEYTEAIAVKYWVRFMKQFFTHFDEFRGREIYIVGQDFFGAKLIPQYVKAMKNIDTFQDTDFNSPWLEYKLPKNFNSFSKWINLKGVAIGSPVIDEGEQREQGNIYAEKKLLISGVESFMLGYPLEWCEQAIKSKNLWAEAFACRFAESFIYGNPLYPLFDVRNVQKECKGWLTCQRGGEN